MKTIQNFTILYILLVIAQAVICNYFSLGPYISLSLLPALILCLPLNKSTSLTMGLAFITGLSVDILSEGLLGLNTLALVPVALLRKPIVIMTMGAEALEKNEPFNTRYESTVKITLAVIMTQIVFLSVYIIADGAGVRPMWFNLSRFGASLASNTLLSLLAIHMLNYEERR